MKTRRLKYIDVLTEKRMPETLQNKVHQINLLCYTERSNRMPQSNLISIPQHTLLNISKVRYRDNKQYLIRRPPFR